MYLSSLWMAVYFKISFPCLCGCTSLPCDRLFLYSDFSIIFFFQPIYLQIFLSISDNLWGTDCTYYCIRPPSACLQWMWLWFL